MMLNFPICTCFLCIDSFILVSCCYYRLSSFVGLHCLDGCSDFLSLLLGSYHLLLLFSWEHLLTILLFRVHVQLARGSS
ncbi:hypothetical protein ZIOFF_003488 [Zingiber officinale]|uniref:Uncharacterized protein n=1 Tax=Zingiber officinale TaxID=94328 RepID=A0A8J5HYJ2_ZINOF|nr:hypothetical protein ZIOFF_003488 [Zingiber officinale]